MQSVRGPVFNKIHNPMIKTKFRNFIRSCSVSVGLEGNGGCYSRLCERIQRQSRAIVSGAKMPEMER